jgi:hypothetical protein
LKQLADSAEKIKNARQLPQILYGRHMSPGVAEYRPAGEAPFRILVNEDAIRKMDKSFSGKPVYVRHVDEVNLSSLQAEADGYVFDSFFNEADGAHWVRMIVVSDKGHEAVRKGWKLSNAYMPKTYAPGGISKGVEYQRELIDGEYEHLAIVDDPRYEDSVILTPEEFKKFNEDKLADLRRLSNSKEKRSMWDLFKRTKVESDLTPDTIIKLPKSGKEVTLEALVNAMDKAEEGEDKAPPSEKPAPEEKETPAEEKAQGDAPEAEGEGKKLANDDHHVAMKDGSTMSVAELRTRHDRMQDCMNTLAEMAKPKEEKAEGEVQEKEVVKKNEDKSEEKAEEKDATKNDDDTHLDPEKVKGFEAGFGGTPTPPPAPEPAPKPTTNAKHFEVLKHAEAAARSRSRMRHVANGVTRGKQLFGSK